ncbi:hypothetical protein FMM05_00265 [Flavobacterium zepuense]|uniref:Transmembrane protein n=1 Tax=Flavobacterium zepuense TaxID=2593302 RepID=A0A552V9I0_9FLAO|nr:hypothetical protein [Flavobacterium zepuense]TRW27120.1 hypothetical protein FMM05_00265 [Flavobacterium zepuense]
MKSLRSWLKKAGYNIREFIWPLLELEPAVTNAPVQEFILDVDDENLDQVLSLATKLSESEDERRKGIESKAALFISTISVASSIVVAANAMVISNTNYGLTIVISVFISFTLSIYAARTVWFAVRALERGSYSVLGPSEINFKGNKQEYQKHLINWLIKRRNNNLKTINSKVDSLTMSQEYYKRAIIIICIYSFEIFCQCVYKYMLTYYFSCFFITPLLSLY